MTPLWQTLLLATSVIVAILLSRRGLAVLKTVFSSASRPAAVVLGVVGIIWAVAAQRIEPLQWIAGAMILLAIALKFLDRRRPAISSVHQNYR